ncbi:MAG: hypothetical protein G01um101470_1114, partial [Parcubacteria group bacterium Gr01-1014_70]
VVFVFCAVPAEAHGRYGRGRSSTGALVAAGAIIGTIGLFRLIGSNQAAEVDKTAITEEQRTRREHIRASTVLAAPAALGGSGSARYSSSEGYADIRANIGGDSYLAPDREQHEVFVEEPKSSCCDRSGVDIHGFRSAGELIADQMTAREFRAFGYALREVENPRRAEFAQQTHRDFVVPALYELLFKLKSAGASEEQVDAWWSVIRYLERAGGV